MFYIKAFLDYLALERNYSPHTIAFYKEDLENFAHFLETLDAELDVTKADVDVVRRWVVALMERQASAATVARRLSALRSFYRFMLLRGWVKSDPARLVRSPKKQRPLPYFLKESEMNRLLDEIPFEDSYEGQRDRLILSLFYGTGIRLSELVGLDLKDIDLESGQLKVTGKRDKQRIVPFGPELIALLRDYLPLRAAFLGSEENDALFLSRRYKRISAVAVRSCVHDHLSKVTTIKKRTPHVLRHTFATAMLNHGADIEVVKELLGHESLATTEIYTHTTFEELKKVYNQAHPRA